MQGRWNARVASAILVTILSLLAASAALALDRKYNPYTQEWEVVPQDSTVQTNPMTGEKEFARPGSVPKYNPYTNQWEIVPPEYQPRFNSYTNQWEMASPDATLQYDPYSGTMRYMPPEAK